MFSLNGLILMQADPSPRLPSASPCLFDGCTNLRGRFAIQYTYEIRVYGIRNPNPNPNTQNHPDPTIS